KNPSPKNNSPPIAPTQPNPPDPVPQTASPSWESAPNASNRMAKLPRPSPNHSGCPLGRAPSRNSTASKPLPKNYQTKPFSLLTVSKRSYLPTGHTNPIA